MFKKNKELKYLAVGALLISVFGLIVSYVAMSTALNIREANNIWKVRIVDLEVDTTSGASQSNMGVEVTSLKDMNFIFYGNGTVTYKFKVKNTGAVDAVLKSINYGRSLCNGNNCENVSYKLTYVDGRDVLEGDVVNYGTYMDMRLVISYEGTGVNIDDFDFIMLYEQA